MPTLDNKKDRVSEVMKRLLRQTKGVKSPSSMQEQSQTDKQFPAFLSGGQQQPEKQSYATPMSAQSAPNNTSPVTGANIGLSPWGKPLTGAIPEDKWAGIVSGNQGLADQFRNAGETRFGTINDRQITSMVNKVVNEGMPIEEAMKLLNSGYQYDETRRSAADRADMAIKPQENALARALESLGRARERDTQAQTLYSQYGDKKLQEIFALLNSQLEGGVQKMGSIFSDAQQNTGNAYQQATQANQQGLQEITGQLTGDAERLGLQEALTDPLAELAQQVIQANTGLNSQMAGATGNLAGLGGAMQGVAQQGVMDANREGAQSRTNLVNNVQSTLADIMSQFGEAEVDLQGQMSDLSQSRGPMLRTLYEDLTKAKSEEERQKVLDDHAMRIQQGALDLQRDEFNFNQERWGQEFSLTRSQQEFENTLRMADHNMAREKHALEIKQLEQQLAGASPYEQQVMQLEIQKRQAEINKLNAQTDQLTTGAGKPMGQGQSGVANYAQRNGLDPSFTQAVMAHINQINGFQGAAGLNTHAYAIQDAHNVAAKLGLDPRHFLAAINTYFGKG